MSVKADERRFINGEGKMQSRPYYPDVFCKFPRSLILTLFVRHFCRKTHGREENVITS